VLKNIAATCFAAALVSPVCCNAGDSLDFSLSDGQKQVRLSELPAQITLVSFWRSDCPPCVNELPVLAGVADEGNVRVISIALEPFEKDSGTEHHEHLLHNTPVIALNAPSNPRQLLATFGNRRGFVPFSVILNENREVCFTKAGEVSQAMIKEAVVACK
jgi:thiol-disulfide isomerase/thioredoxin